MKNKKFNLAVLLVLAFALFVPHVGTANDTPLSDEEFIQLIREGGTAQEVEAAIKAGANVNARCYWEQGKPVLLCALQRSDLSHFRLFRLASINNRKFCVDIDALCEDCLAALRLETRGDLEIITLLLQNGADINARDDHDRTALMAAAESLNPEMVEYGYAHHSTNQL